MLEGCRRNAREEYKRDQTQAKHIIVSVRRHRCGNIGDFGRAVLAACQKVFPIGGVLAWFALYGPYDAFFNVARMG
jgi:hypothetical protein